MSWIAENHQLIAALTSIGMLVVWITYLQLFLASYRRQRKATILIRLGQGGGLDAHCLVTNMSAEPIYLHTLVAQLDGPDGPLACPITEFDGEDPAAVHERMAQVLDECLDQIAEIQGLFVDVVEELVDLTFRKILPAGDQSVGEPGDRGERRS